VIPHLYSPLSASNSPIKILNIVVLAIPSGPTKAILSPFSTLKLTSLRISFPSIVLDKFSTVKSSLPASLSALNPTYGYFLEDHKTWINYGELDDKFPYDENEKKWELSRNRMIEKTLRKIKELELIKEEI
jgi:hypothetical protein